MGNARSNYERHEDDEQQQRVTIGKEFHLILGQIDLPLDSVKRKQILSNKHQRYRNVSSSSSNSTIASSSSSYPRHHSSVYCIELDIPLSPNTPNEIDSHALVQYLVHQDSYGKELSHILQIPSTSNNSKSRLKTLPTVNIAAIYYDQPMAIYDFNVDLVCLTHENELENKIQAFQGKNILTIYTMKSTACIIYTKSSTTENQYKLIRSTTMWKTILENFEWLHPFIDYSNFGYRLCGIIPMINSTIETSITIYWIFEKTEIDQYDYSIIEYKFKSFSFDNWLSLLNLMSKQEWKLVSTFDHNQKKKNSEQISILLFFQRLKVSQ